ncbi:MAG TPA: hypothetical protein PL187_04015, partial [Caldilinea sp.]|nr:hypothetical protein [Caldilinea sp.]
MTRYAISRLIATIPTLIVLTIVVFLMLQLVPGDPAEIFLGEKRSIILPLFFHDFDLFAWNF